MKKVLVTGAAGNIGSALTERLVATGDYEVVAVDNLLTGSLDKLSADTRNKCTFIKADVNEHREISEIMLAYRFDFVFHYAAMVGVQRTLQNPLRVLRDIEGIKNILDLCKNTAVNRIFFSSSSEVYGEPVEFPQNEQTTPLNSKLPYAIVKNVGEAFLKAYHQEYGLNYTIFRFFNTYGPRQSEDFVISRFIKQALQGKDITIYGAGNQTRTFCYIDDNIDITLKCLKEEFCLNDVMNLGSDNEITILKLAEKIITLTKSSSKIAFLPALKEGDMTRRMPDNEKMKAILGRPLVDLDSGIRMTVEQRMF
jgi:UDP-glucose 4-epimerase